MPAQAKGLRLRRAEVAVKAGTENHIEAKPVGHALLPDKIEGEIEDARRQFGRGARLGFLRPRPPIGPEIHLKESSAPFRGGGIVPPEVIPVVAEPFKL